jgi:microcystin-dependent protein
MTQFIGGGASVPIGTIAAHPANIPGGWLECDGSAISRTDYAGLFAEIGTNYGAGDGSTTFNLPDLRGEFVRGLDNGRGVDAGRALASAQLDQMQQITGSLRGNDHVFNSTGSAGAFSVSDITGSINGTSGTAGGIMADFDSGNSPDARAGDETRPRNVAMYYAIKY